MKNSKNYLKKEADMKEIIITPLFLQEKYFLQAFALIRRIAFRKLCNSSFDSIEDIVQKVALRLWHWKLKNRRKYLSQEEWLKLANCAIHNEIRSFYSGKNRREISISDLVEEDIIDFRVPPSDSLENTVIGLYSLLVQLREAVRKLSLRQKYALLLRNEQFIIDLVVNKVSTVKEIADLLELSTEELKIILAELPLPDERIKCLLEEKTHKKTTQKQVWEARHKARKKLLKILPDLNIDFVKKGNRKAPDSLKNQEL